MAVAPLNKFLNISVPVAPGEQVVYTTPTGVASIVLYAQVSNVAKDVTYPKVTVVQRRKSRFGNIRDVRIIKEAEVFPNDSLVVLDGRLILERTALYSDSLVVKSDSNPGVVTVTNCVYDHISGIATVTTLQNHNFVAGDEITMSGLEFTCAGYSSGITTTIFPAPQSTFTVDQIDAANVFITNTGVGAGITHTYVQGGKVSPIELEFICSILENSIV